MAVKQTLPSDLVGDVGGLAACIAQGFGAEVEDLIVASTTQTLVGARQLTATLNRVSSANSNDAIKMPPAIPSTTLTIVNTSTQTIQLFPFQAADIINAASAGAAVTIANATTSDYYCITAGQWWGGATTNES